MKWSFHLSGAIGIFLCAVVSMQCNKSDNSIGPVPYSLPDDLVKVVPLQVGNSWTYRSISCGIEGCDTTIDSIRIVDTLWMGGVKCYKYSGNPPHLFGYGEYYVESVGREDYSMYLCLNCLDGAKARPDSGDGLPLHLLKTPLTRGHQWRIAEWILPWARASAHSR